MGAGVEPGEAAVEHGHLEAALLEVAAVEVGDLELAADARPQIGGELADVRAVEVEPRHCEGALGPCRLLLDRECAPVAVELDDAVALRVAHPVAEDPGAVLDGRAVLEHCRQAGAVEDVIAEHETRGPARQELAAEEEGLGEALGPRLLAVGETHAEAAAVAEKLAVGRQVAGRGDDEHLADAGEHQQAQGVIDHGLVVDRQQLLADDHGHRVEAGARAAREDDALHGPTLIAGTISQGLRRPPTRRQARSRGREHGGGGARTYRWRLRCGPSSCG